jgi:hypothetical protein
MYECRIYIEEYEMGYRRCGVHRERHQAGNYINIYVCAYMYLYVCMYTYIYEYIHVYI